MRQIKSINVMQTAKVMGAVYFVLGLAVALFVILPVSMARRGQPGRFFMAALAPFIYGALVFVLSAFLCWVYNLVAERLGGIEVEVIESP